MKFQVSRVINADILILTPNKEFQDFVRRWEEKGYSKEEIYRMWKRVEEGENEGI
jgi:hypothetical protein